MGIYNCADTLEEALDSLMAQTYQGFKVIMCEDGSKDKTFEIANNYIKKFPEKFILIKNEKNMGLNYTLNRCLDLVDTEYVARMDGDDISLPDRFEKEIDFLDANPEYDIVSSPMIYFDEDGDYKIGRGGGKVIVNKDFLKGSPFCHAPCMVRTKAYQDVGGYSISQKLLGVEDYHLWFKMYSKGYKGYVLQEPLYKMRDDENAAKRRSFKRYMRVHYVMITGFKMLKISKLYYIYSFRPIITALTPKFIYNYYHKKK